MLDNEFTIDVTAVAGCVSLINSKMEYHKTKEETQHSLNELDELLRTLGLKSIGQYFQKKDPIEAGTILGTGKLEEIAKDAKEKGATILVFDIELSAGQIRNISKLTGMSVVDRCHIILEIFAKHARTSEAKIQIEISRLGYMLPRLIGFWTHFSRQKGAVGVRGGEGEQQIELDRRIIRNRIESLKVELKRLEISRHEQKKKRSKKAITAALVGYTNAGKSSLMNRLCQVDILEEDKLFATLDSTFRMLNPDTHPPMIMIDTVGFISNLPNTLIEGFKTTLESAMEADLLIIVADISDESYEKQLEVTSNILCELGLENKEKILVFNKKDKIDPMKAKIIRRGHKDSFLICSFDDEDINHLRRFIIDYFLSKQKSYDLFIPYQFGEAHSQVISKTNVLKSAPYDTGIFYRINAPDFIFAPLNLNRFILGPNDPMRKNWPIDFESN